MCWTLLFPFYSAGLIPPPGITLFTYPPHRSYYNYFDPGFTADIRPTFDSRELEQQATLLCDGDEFCLYDVAVTGQLEVGNLTKMTSQRRMELIDLSKPSKTSEAKMSMNTGLTIDGPLGRENWIYSSILLLFSLCTLEKF